MARRIDTLGEDFGQLFARFEHTAYRLETLQHYSIPYEDEPLRRFNTGLTRPADSAKDEWTSFLREAVSVGKTIQRVHLVQEPPSDYLRYELAWSYDESVEAGEDVRIIPFLPDQWPGSLPDHDYWLFDSRDLWVMTYDDAGRFLYTELSEDAAEIVRHGYWRDTALHQAISYDEYMQRHPALQKVS